MIKKMGGNSSKIVDARLLILNAILEIEERPGTLSDHDKNILKLLKRAHDKLFIDR